MNERYDLEELRRAMDTIRAFNALDLRTVELYHNGIPVTLKDGAVDEWQFVGLSNSLFAQSIIYPEPE